MGGGVVGREWRQQMKQTTLKARQDLGMLMQGDDSAKQDHAMDTE